jgi:ATP-dependent Clp protease ATP-binding subunit ClpB
VDDVIVFSRLTREQIRQIVDIQLELLKRRLAERRISLELTDQAKDHLAAEGYDPVYGARPLKRMIQRLVADPLALKLLAGEFSDDDTVVVDLIGGELSFSAGTLRV